MLLLVLGGIASGKSAYAVRWATTLGREAIRFSCPPFPDCAGSDDLPAPDAGSGFGWKELPAGGSLASTVDQINYESNIFRADRRVLVVDSLSGWLRGWALRAGQAGWQPGEKEPDPEDTLNRVVQALLTYQGKRIVVTEEPAALLARDPWDRWYAAALAEAVRQLADESQAVYRLTSGIAAEVKGHRVKRRIPHEHLYPDRR